MTWREAALLEDHRHGKQALAGVSDELVGVPSLQAASKQERWCGRRHWKVAVSIGPLASSWRHPSSHGSLDP